MSADSKEPRLPPGVPIDVAPAERRDTLRGVGDPMDPHPDSDTAPPPPEEEDRRLRQVEFTVPPQLWRRPPSGWFRQFARGPAPAPVSPPEPKPSEGGATIEGAAGQNAAQPTSSSTRWLPFMLMALAALALFAGWRLLRTPAPNAAAVNPPATATLRPPEPTATATPTVAEPQPAPASPSVVPPPPAPAETSRPIKKTIGASPPSSATAPSTSAPPSTAHGPIY